MVEEAEIHVNDIETIPDWLNKLARESEPNRHFPPEFSFDDVLQLCIQLDERMNDQGTIAELQNDTFLSRREAEVIGYKFEGLTHEAIALRYSVVNESKLSSGSSEGGLGSRSTVDEYSRRAKEKFKKSKQTVSLLDPLY